ncbi:TIGR02147 family protein [Bdellovibrio bacteriovorus]|uniref:TIGR02147 family protein n=1 Tax=Bdellovibrio TaxID=958 RepID=UPI0035A88B3C
MATEKPQIKKYLSSFKFLQDYYSFRKETEPFFSYEAWAREAGFDDRTYLRLVVSGKRPINEKMMILFQNSLQLDAEERLYFSALVNYTQSKNQEQRKVFEMQLSRMNTPKVEQDEIKNHYEFLANPLLAKLKTLLSFADIPKTSEKLALIFDVEVTEMDSALLALEKMGLAHKVEQAGEVHWQSNQRSWKVPSEFMDNGLREFYRNSLVQAQQAIDYPVEDRRFRSLFLAMSSEEYQGFLKDFEEFVQERLKKHDVDAYENRRLFQLNFNFFATSNYLNNGPDSQR